MLGRTTAAARAAASAAAPMARVRIDKRPFRVSSATERHRTKTNVNDKTTAVGATMLLCELTYHASPMPSIEDFRQTTRVTISDACKKRKKLASFDQNADRATAEAAYKMEHRRSTVRQKNREGTTQKLNLKVPVRNYTLLTSRSRLLLVLLLPRNCCYLHDSKVEK